MPPKKPLASKPAAKTTAAKPGAKTTASKGTSTAAKGSGAVAKGGATSAPKKEEAKPIKKIITPEEIGLKEIATVLTRSGAVGTKLKESNRPLYIIDQTERVGTFLKYRDTNMIIASIPTDFQTEPIRKGILGSLCFGKPFVLDISDTVEEAIMELVKEKINAIYDGLYNDILDGSVIEEDKCMKIKNNSDPADYDQYYNYRFAEFLFVILSKTESIQVKEDFFPVIVA